MFSQLGASSQEGEEELVKAGEGWDPVQLSDCRNGRSQIVVASFSFKNNLVNKIPLKVNLVGHHTFSE